MPRLKCLSALASIIVSERDFWINKPPPPSTPPIRSWGDYRHVPVAISHIRQPAQEEGWLAGVDE
jgi:hypothetical protein